MPQSQPSLARHTADPSLLNTTQRLIFDKVLRHANCLLSGQSVPQILLNIDGTAGTGKSFLIDAISQALQELQTNHHLSNHPIVRRLAPTGVAAFNIAGSTYHAALGLGGSIEESHDKLGEGKLAILQEEWHGTRYLIIDEKSMVGRAALGRINLALGQIFPATAYLPFAGLSVLLIGDFGQLPPVGDTPLYNTARSTKTSYLGRLSNIGRDVYLAFTESMQLDAVMRQDGSDPTTVAFKSTLARLHSGTPLQEDYTLLSTRFWTALSPASQHTFRDAVCLCATKQSVSEINLHTLLRSGQPVLRSLAQHTGVGAAQASEEQAQGLVPAVFLMAGAQVMLSRNLWIEQGLVNGTRGTIYQIGLSPSEVPHHSVPSVVMVAFPSYTGPTPWRTTDNVPLVPIVPHTARWEAANGQRCTRRQLPLQLAFAITIHKSQGMTLDKAVIDLGPADFSTGLTFVAISRVRSLDGLAFRPGFDWARLNSLNTESRRGGISGRMLAARDAARRQMLHLIE